MTVSEDRRIWYWVIFDVAGVVGMSVAVAILFEALWPLIVTVLMGAVMIPLRVILKRRRSRPPPA